MNNLALVLEEHLNSSFDIFDLVLTNIQDIITSELINHKVLSEEYIQKIIRRLSFLHKIIFIFKALFKF